MLNDVELQAWDRQSGETSLWFERFQTFLQLGPTRTIEECYRRRLTVESAISGSRAPSGWSQHAQKYNWWSRATAYDDDYRERIAEADKDRRLWGREHRIEVLNKVLGGALQILEAADLPGLVDEPDRARRMLGIARAMFHDALQAHRLEMGEPTSIEQRRVVDFTADDWAEAERLSSDWSAGVTRFGDSGQDGPATDS